MKSALSLKVYLLFITLFLTACGGGGESTPTGGGSGNDPVEISGSVVKGPVNGASVTVYAVNADGTRGAKLAGPFTTGSDGSWTG